MNKNSRVGFMMTADQAFKFFERCIEAEKALGQPLTMEEKDVLLATMMKGNEITLEELKDMVAGKKVLRIVHRGDQQHDR